MTDFQIKPITNEAEHSAALERFELLLDAKEGTKAAYQRDVLAILIEKYEEEAIPLPLPNPVDAIKFRLEQAGLTRKVLESILGGKTRVSEILSGKRELTMAMARGLHTQLGIPAESLLGVPAAAEEPDANPEWEKYPVVEMERNGTFVRFGLSDLRGKAELAVGRLVDYLGGWEALPVALFRTSASTRRNAKLDIYALRGWCLQVLAEAKDLPVGPFVPDIFTPTVLRELVQLSARRDGPLAAKEFLAARGVALVAVKHLKNTYLDGAAFVTSDRKAVIGLTFRYNRLDNFWFALLHELGHLVLHLGDQQDEFYIDDLTLRGNQADSDKEREADDFAEKTLLPDDFTLDQQDFITALDVVQYAQHHGISPAIVAGRIQHTKQNYRIFANLLGRDQVRL